MAVFCNQFSFLCFTQTHEYKCQCKYECKFKFKHTNNTDLILQFILVFFFSQPISTTSFSMQSINIDRGIALIESKLHGKKCMTPLITLAKEHPDCINRYIMLAEAIDADLSTRCICPPPSSYIASTVRVSSQREQCSGGLWRSFLDSAFFVIPNVSAMVPKGKYTIAFCNKCFYLDSSAKQIRIDYSK